jgi:hypothetical protein
MQRLPRLGISASTRLLSTKFYEKDGKRKISTCAVFANAGQD